MTPPTTLPAPAAIGGDADPARRRRLRIAVVSETYPPEVNGVALTVARVVDGLRGRRHTLQLVRPRQDAAAGPAADADLDEVLLRGLPIPRYPHLKMGLPATQTLRSLWSRCRPDVVHIATEGPLGWSALQAATRLRLPVTSDFRTNFHAYSRHYGIGWLQRPIVAYLRSFHNRTACTMVPTAALQRQLAAQGFRNLAVVARGVDTTLFDPARRSDALRRGWGAGPRTRVVLCVGRLAPEKNLGALLLAFDAMRRIDPDLKLVLVGDGPARHELARRCPDAIFAGLRAGEDLAAHYASGDLFLFPSVTETFGNVTPEAMASGLPVLAYDGAAAAQLIESGRNGLLARFDDTPDFVHAAQQLAADRAAAQRMGLQARQTAAALDWEQVIGEIEARLRSAIRDAGVDADSAAPERAEGAAQAPAPDALSAGPAAAAGRGAAGAG